MNKNTQLGHNIKRQIDRFVQKNMLELSKPGRKFVFDMLFGVLKGSDSKITNVGRALHERCDLKHTIKRLYNHLSNEDYTELIDKVMFNTYKREVNNSTVFALDFSDITKPYAEKMEYLTTVRDGDKGTFGLGYNNIVLTATELGENDPTVLANKVFSKSATPDKKSTDIALKILDDIVQLYGTKGIYTQDRYFDNKRFYNHFHSKGLSFVTRAKINRKLLKVNSNGVVIPGKVSIVDLAKRCRTPHTSFIERWENGNWKRVKKVRVGARKVFLPCINQIITLVVVKGYGKMPMMLLTNINVDPKRISEVLQIYDIYRSRWKTEEWIRFVKCEYHLEDIRTLNWQSLNNMVSFVNLATSFIMVQIGLSSRLMTTKMHLLRSGKPVFVEKAKMILHMVVYGLREILKTISAEYRKLKIVINNDIQMELAL